MKHRKALAALALALAPWSGALAQGTEGGGGPGAPTRVVIHVVAHDAKLIGSHTGGVRVAILDEATGDTLASGTQAGGTGDTDLIMRRSRERGQPVFDTPGAAAFRATLRLARPTRVRIVAEGPLGIPQAVQRASTTLLLVPGHDLSGDGVALDLHGLAVRIDVPATEAAGAGPSIQVRATVTMLCGCPITPGGLWDASGVQVRARLERGDTVAAETSLRYAGTPSTFAGRITAPDAGEYRLVLIASEPDRANFGRAETTLRVGGG